LKIRLFDSMTRNSNSTSHAPFHDVVVISNGFQPEYEAGFSNGLVENGVSVTLISSDHTLVNRIDSRILLKNFRGTQREDRSSIKKAFNLIRYYVFLIAFLARRRPIIHLIGLFSLNHIRTSWADRSWKYECAVMRALSKKLILTVHNVVPHDRDSSDVRAELRKVYAMPAEIVVHTERARQRLIEEFDVRSEHITVMEHGVDSLVTPVNTEVVETRLRYSIDPRQRFALFFGSVQPYKGVDLLLDAAVKFNDDVHLLVAGRCLDSAYSDALSAQISVHPRRDHIQWENRYLSEEDASKLLSAADVVVMPYRHIDQSGVLFAAFRHGARVVAFDVGSFREYLPFQCGDIVQAGNTDQLARTVNCTPSASSKSRALVLDYARQFLWSETIKKILFLY
jgi:glycosyltransferase involved in cell wall biosynthesis